MDRGLDSTAIAEVSKFMGLELPWLLVFSALADFAVESVTSSHIFALFGLSKSQP